MLSTLNHTLKKKYVSVYSPVPIANFLFPIVTKKNASAALYIAAKQTRDLSITITVLNHIALTSEALIMGILYNTFLYYSLSIVFRRDIATFMLYFVHNIFL